MTFVRSSESAKSATLNREVLYWHFRKKQTRIGQQERGNCRHIWIYAYAKLSFFRYKLTTKFLKNSSSKFQIIIIRLYACFYMQCPLYLAKYFHRGQASIKLCSWLRFLYVYMRSLILSKMLDNKHQRLQYLQCWSSILPW